MHPKLGLKEAWPYSYFFLKNPKHVFRLFVKQIGRTHLFKVVIYNFSEKFIIWKRDLIKRKNKYFLCLIKWYFSDYEFLVELEFPLLRFQTQYYSVQIQNFFLKRKWALYIQLVYMIIKLKALQILNQTFSPFLIVLFLTKKTQWTNRKSNMGKNIQF